MTEALATYFVDLFNGLDKNLIIFVISMLPIFILLSMFMIVFFIQKVSG